MYDLSLIGYLQNNADINPPNTMRTSTTTEISQKYIQTQVGTHSGCAIFPVI